MKDRSTTPAGFASAQTVSETGEERLCVPDSAYRLWLSPL